MHMSIFKLTTASQSGGWVHKTPGNFHCWQPAPRWRPLPWLANPGNPAMRSHMEGEKTGTRHTDKTVERKGGTGKGRQPPTSPHAQENANAQKRWLKRQQNCYNALWTKNTRSPGACAYIPKPLTARVKLVLRVVNSVKLHLTAFNNL